MNVWYFSSCLIKTIVENVQNDKSIFFININIQLLLIRENSTMIKHIRIKENADHQTNTKELDIKKYILIVLYFLFFCLNKNHSDRYSRVRIDVEKKTKEKLMRSSIYNYKDIDLSSFY